MTAKYPLRFQKLRPQNRQIHVGAEFGRPHSQLCSQPWLHALSRLQGISRRISRKLYALKIQEGLIYKLFPAFERFQLYSIGLYNYPLFPVYEWIACAWMITSLPQSGTGSETNRVDSYEWFHKSLPHVWRFLYTFVSITFAAYWASSCKRCRFLSIMWNRWLPHNFYDLSCIQKTP